LLATSIIQPIMIVKFINNIVFQVHEENLGNNYVIMLELIRNDITTTSNSEDNDAEESV